MTGGGEEEVDFDAAFDAALDEALQEDDPAGRQAALEGMLGLMETLGIDGVPIPLPLLDDAEEIAPGLFGRGPFPADLSIDHFRRAVSRPGGDFFLLGLLGVGQADRRLILRVRYGNRAVAGDVFALDPRTETMQPADSVAARAFVAAVSASLSLPRTGGSDGVTAVAIRTEDGEDELCFVGPGETSLAYAGAGHAGEPFGGLFGAPLPPLDRLVRSDLLADPVAL